MPADNIIIATRNITALAAAFEEQQKQIAELCDMIDFYIKRVGTLTGEVNSMKSTVAMNTTMIRGSGPTA